MTESTVPFGLLFLENDITPAEQRPYAYDEERDVSVLEVNGVPIPVVSAADSRMSTETLTEVAGESTDQPSLATSTDWWLSTDTETKAAEDLTAGAPHPYLVAAPGTDIETRVADDET
jgi:hypothetical protein